jgi:hypothetical protein
MTLPMHTWPLSFCLLRARPDNWRVGALAATEQVQGVYSVICFYYYRHLLQNLFKTRDLSFRVNQKQ